MWLLALVVACGGAPAAREGRVVVLGLDGLEHSLLDRMMAAGDLPNFQALAREGARADMRVTEPIMSPILWTTIASGYPGEKHGIGGWTTGRGHAYSGADVRALRIWDVLTAANEPSVVSGWLMTWPATPIRGSMLSERFVWSFPMNKDPNERSAQAAPLALSGTTSPPSLADRASALRPDDAWIAAHPLAYQVQEYGAPFHPLIRDETHLRVFESTWPGSEARFGAVYLNGADQVSHLYWPFVDPAAREKIRKDPEARVAAAAAERKEGRRAYPYADRVDALDAGATWVPDYYRYLDTALGRVRAVLAPDTTLIVCSDHGFRESSAQPLLNGSHNDIAAFYAVGPRVRAGARAEVHVFDVAPTIYTLLGHPVAADMPGGLMDTLFDLPAAPTPVSTRLIERPSLAPSESGDLADDQLRAQLQALGYLDEEGRPDAAIGASRRER